MRKAHTTLLLAGLLSLAALVSLDSATQAAEPELRPSQVAMRARAGWMQSMGENLAAQKLDLVQADAKALAGQANAVAQKLDNPLAKELTLRLASQAEAVAGAAGAKNAAGVQQALADTKAVCGECHAKIRDKK